MLLLDSNIIIYSAQNQYDGLRDRLRDRSLAISIISKIEVLGFHNITPYEIDRTNFYLGMCEIIDLNHKITLTAIQLRQNKKMSLGDAIIAATALERRLTLATANIKDFDHIENLSLINPMEMI